MRRAVNMNGAKPASPEEAAEAGQATPLQQQIKQKKSSAAGRQHGCKPARLLSALCACLLCCLLPFVLATVSSSFRTALLSHQMRVMGLPTEWASLAAVAHASRKINPIPEAHVQSSHLLKPLAQYEAAATQGPFPVHLNYNILWNSLILTRGGEFKPFFPLLLVA